MHKKISKILIDLAKKDQLMRKSTKWDTHVDKENTEKLKEIINAYGWPDIDLVGEKAAYAAWLIAQHADHDISFQKKTTVRYAILYQ